MNSAGTNHGGDRRAPSAAAASGKGPGVQQYLTFKLAGEEYGLGILQVQEIRGWAPVTAIPHAPPWVLGVIDLRGIVVPIVDLRRRFQLEPAEFGPSTVVIVIRVGANGEDRTIGLVVDAVSEVHDISENALRPLPDVGSTASRDVVSGLAQADGKTLILLDARELAASATH
jgi:purine-binding chemotaxis protein CheW